MDLRVGTYALWLPADASAKADVVIPPVDDFGQIGTVWEIGVGTFNYFIHLDCNRQPEFLAEFILSCTR